MRAGGPHVGPRRASSFCGHARCSDRLRLTCQPQPQQQPQRPHLSSLVGTRCSMSSPQAGWPRSISGRLLGPVGFGRTVAVKRLHPHYLKDEEFITMFMDEARIVARIRHPNVVPMVDVVQGDKGLFLVMEYVHGESLSTPHAQRAQGERAHPAAHRRGDHVRRAPRPPRGARDEGTRRRAARRRPSRRLAAERDRRHRRQRARARLRHREGRGARPGHARGSDQGQARVHGARADPRSGRSSDRRVRGGRRPLGDARRAAAPRKREGRRHRHAHHAGQSHAPEPIRAEHPAGARRRS